MAFAICFLDLCPVHKVPLEKYNHHQRVYRQDYRLAAREPLIKEIDEQSTVLVNHIRRTIDLTTTVEPMREARMDPSRFSWRVAGLIKKNDEKGYRIGESSRLNIIDLAGCYKARENNIDLDGNTKTVYYQELAKMGAEVALGHQRHLPSCRLRERLICGVCAAYDTFSHCAISPSSRMKFYRWFGSSLWPSLKQLEQWLLTPVLGQWLVPRAALECVERMALRALLQHELKRLLYAHLLHGMLLERFPDQEIRRALFVEAYQEGWPGACVVCSSQRQLVLPEIRIRDIFAIDSEEFLLFNHR